MNGSLNALGAVHSALRSSMMRWWLALNSYPQKLSTGKKNLWTTRRSHAQVIHILASSLTMPVASTLAGEPLRRIARRRCLVLVGVLCVLQTAPANAVEQSDLLKLYAHSRIINYEQFKCFDALITRESHWRVDAKNGSHYGLGQMRNAKYGRLDGFSMVDWSIRYITKRYGSMCNSWRFFKANGYH
jgi:hypothetical protein